MSGRRGSNSRPIAWKAIALSTELLPQKYTVQSLHHQLFIDELCNSNRRQKKVGRDGFEPPKVKTSRFTVCPIWPLWYLPDFDWCLERWEPMEGFEPPTSWLQISCSGQLSYIGVNHFGVQRYNIFFNLQIFCKLFSKNFLYSLFQRTIRTIF